MAKKDKKKDANYDAGIIETNIATACKDYMRIYSANNNLMRHIPEVFDGLKIGERRILYTMYRLGLNYNKPPTKVSYIVGRTMLYHPHGDAAISDTLVKLAQSWSNIQPAVVGVGNFGSPAGEPAAAGRYIEAKMSLYAYKCFFEEFSPNVVKMRSNYLGNDIEPEYLPAKYPNTLINNGFGIGYGVSTSIPTYNFKECCQAAIHLIKNPDDNIILYPDSPTGAYIVDERQFPEICATGKGKFKMRGVIKIDNETNSLIISSTPLMVYWENIKSKVLNLLIDSANNGKHNVLKEVIDESDENNMRFRIVLKKEADPVTVMYMIYKKTDMEKTFSVKFKLTESYSDNYYTIKSLLQTWIDFRRETKRSIYAKKFVDNKEREHILDILIMILNKDNAEKTVSIFKKSENVKETAKALMKTYGISSLQAKTIADMKFSALTKEAYKRYVKEKEEVTKEISKIEKIIRSAKKIDKIIIDELEEGIRLFGEDRRSEIITVDNEIKIRDTEHTIIFTKNNMIKKLPRDIDNTGRIGSGDYIVNTIYPRNTDTLMIFDNKGKAIKLPVAKIANSTLNSEGSKLSDYCNITGDVVTVRMFVDEKFLKKNKIKEPMYILMVSKNGLIKKMSVDTFSNMRNDVIAMALKDGDSVADCIHILNDVDIIVYTEQGMGICFNTSEIPETGRLSSGVQSMQLGENDAVKGICNLVEHKPYVMITTVNGNCKKTTTDTITIVSRRTKSIRLMSVNPNDTVLSVTAVSDNDKCVISTRLGMKYLINADVDICDLPRLSKGKRLPMLSKTDTVVSVKMYHK